MFQGEEEYYEFLRKMEFIPASYKEIANSFMQNGVKEMYHALVNEDDIETLFTIPNLKVFWCCRCHLVADDKSTSHEHLHALVQYNKRHTHRAFKKRLQRSNQRLHPKTTFKKILCPDHAVGVLRYICCSDGQRKNRRRDVNGFVSRAHKHYSRNVFEKYLLHKRSAKINGGCKDIRCTILEKIWEELSEEWLEENISGDSEYALHHTDICSCDNGKIGKKKRELANKKRRDFYKTAKGVEIKKRWKENAKSRDEILEKMMELKTNTSDGAIEKEMIIKLIKRMK